MRADIAWVNSGRVRAVVDAKYKTHTASGDLYQMLAYCTVIGLRAGHLVYADGGGSTTHQVRNADVEILTHVLDLDLPPAALLAGVDALTDLIASNALTKSNAADAQRGVNRLSGWPRVALIGSSENLAFDADYAIGPSYLLRNEIYDSLED